MAEFLANVSNLDVQAFYRRYQIWMYRDFLIRWVWTEWIFGVGEGNHPTAWTFPS